MTAVYDRMNEIDSAYWQRDLIHYIPVDLINQSYELQ